MLLLFLHTSGARSEQLRDHTTSSRCASMVIWMSAVVSVETNLTGSGSPFEPKTAFGRSKCNVNEHCADVTTIYNIFIFTELLMPIDESDICSKKKEDITKNEMKTPKKETTKKALAKHESWKRPLTFCIDILSYGKKVIDVLWSFGSSSIACSYCNHPGDYSLAFIAKNT